MPARKLSTHTDRMKWLALKQEGYSNEHIGSLSQVSAASVGYTINRLFELVWMLEGLPGDYPGLRRIKKHKQMSDLVKMCFRNEPDLRALYGKHQRAVDRHIGRPRIAPIAGSLTAVKKSAPAKRRNPFSVIASWFTRSAA